MPKVAVFTTGVHKGKNYSEADLHDMARNFKQFSAGSKPLVRVPAVLGHEETQEYLERSDLPAAAWGENCYVKPAEGKDGVVRPTLFVDFNELPPKVKRLLKGKAYRTVSAEVYDKPPEGIPGKGKMLRRVAFLGGDIPQVKSIDDIPEPVEHAESGSRHVPVLLQFREARQTPAGTYWCFSEAGTMDRAAMIQALIGKGVDQALITDAIPDPVLAEWLRTLNDTGVVANDDDEDAKKKAAAEAAAKNADSEPPPPPTDADSAKKFKAYADAQCKKYGADTVAPDPDKQVAMNDKPVKMSELPTLIAQGVADALKGDAGKAIAELQKFREDTIAEGKRATITAFCENAKTTGHVLPWELEPGPLNIIDRLMRLDAKEIVHKFTENGKNIEATALDLEKRAILKRTPLKFGERAKGGAGGAGADDETSKVEAHFEKFSENYAKLGQTKESFTKAFEAERKRHPGLTADEYLTV